MIGGIGPLTAGHCGSTGDEATIGDSAVGSSGENLLIEDKGLDLAHGELNDDVDVIEHVANLEAVAPQGDMQIMDVEKRTMGASMSTGKCVENDCVVGGYDVSDCTFDVTLHRSNPNAKRV